MAAAFIQSSFQSVSKLSRFVGNCLSGSALKSTLGLSPQMPSTALSANASYVQVRNKHFDHHFLNRWMARDYKRRLLVKEHFPERQRLVAMKRCSVLPKEFQEVVSKELEAMPRDSCFVRVRPRCLLTSRPRWVIRKYRLSRITYRNLADYNKLSGVLRATW